MAHNFHISPHDNQARPCGAETCPFGADVISGSTMEEAQRNFAIQKGFNAAPSLNKKQQRMAGMAKMDWQKVDTAQAFDRGAALAAQLKQNGFKVKDAQGKDFPTISLAKPQTRKATQVRPVNQRSFATSQSLLDKLTQNGKEFTVKGRDGSSHSINKDSSGSYRSTSVLKDGTKQVFPKIASFSMSHS